MGNSEAIARQHYLTTTEEHYALATTPAEGEIQMRVAQGVVQWWHNRW